MDNIYKYAHIERERRFLLLAPPEGLKLDGDYNRIVDLYLPNTRLRLRRVETAEGQVIAYKMTQKYASEEKPDHQRVITNIYLDANEYAKMSRLGGRQLVKRRYFYDYNDDHYAIDIFAGHLRGLVLAEIESIDDLALSQLVPPPFAIREVTQDPFFTGGHLAQLTAAQFREWLARVHQQVV